MGFLRKKDRQFVAQIDIVEQQYEELLQEYAELKTAFQKLRHKRIELVKQIDNLNDVIEEAE